MICSEQPGRPADPGARMFTVEQREHYRERLLKMARSDHRVVAGALVGAEAAGRNDRWSDLDLTFAVAPGAVVAVLLDDWTRDLTREFDAVHLFDLPARSSLYRVFLLPGTLQLDLSFTPADDFGAVGPDFRLLFGDAVEKPHNQPPRPQDLFGLAVHHLVRARFCIERGRLWQAEYWISGARDDALTIACLRGGLNPWHGRGFDQLPAAVLDQAKAGVAGAVDRQALLVALDATVSLLLSETLEELPAAQKLEGQLRTLSSRL